MNENVSSPHDLSRASDGYVGSSNVCMDTLYFGTAALKGLVALSSYVLREA